MYRLCLLVLAVAASVGCGHSGTARKEVSGEVFYRNQPVPAGVVFFEPQAGVVGPQGIADIVEGHFRTRTDWGPFAGRHTARVQFYLTPGKSREATLPAYGEGGTLIVEQVNYVTQVEIPAEGGEPIRIEIPDELR